MTLGPDCRRERGKKFPPNSRRPTRNGPSEQKRQVLYADYHLKDAMSYFGGLSVAKIELETIPAKRGTARSAKPNSLIRQLSVQLARPWQKNDLHLRLLSCWITLVPFSLLHHTWFPHLLLPFVFYWCSCIIEPNDPFRHSFTFPPSLLICLCRPIVFFAAKSVTRVTLWFAAIHRPCKTTSVRRYAIKSQPIHYMH